MCLAVPMKILEIRNEDTGLCELEGNKQEVNLSLIDNPAPGDFVIIHAGFAIERLDQEEARERIEMFAEMARDFDMQA